MPEKYIDERKLWQKIYDEGNSLDELSKITGVKKSTLRYYVDKRSRGFPDEQVFVENSSYSRGQIKARIIKENMIPHECAVCFLVNEWNGNILVLRLDHINGVKNDHRKENLRFLCPNCDSQQPTYSGRNSWKKKRVMV